MNIAFDAVAVFGAPKNRGMGYYVKQLIRHILKNDTKNKYFLFNCLEETSLFNEECSNFREDYFYLGEKLMLGEHKALNVLYGDLLKRYVKKNKIDVFVITVPFAVGPYVGTPQGGHLPVYRREWLNGCQVVVIAYDLIPKIFKEYYLNDASMQKLYGEQHEQLTWADHIMSISQCTKNDLVNLSQIPEKRITCIWGGYKDGIGQVKITSKDWQEVGEKFGIRQGFIMAPLGDDFRKNMQSLVKAYAELPSSMRKKHQLVVVCAISPLGRNQLEVLAEKYNCKEDFIMTDFVSDEMMNKLYNMADLVAFPSKYEGFGMPIVEAFLCGTPVLTSKNSACGEIAGNAAYLVDPFSVEDMARGLKLALNDSHREDYIQAGFEQVKKFHWNQVAKRAIAAIENMGGVTDEKESMLDTYEKKRIAFFSSLPPIKSGISDYSVDILWELAKYYNIDVFIDDGYEASCILPENVKVYNHRSYLADRYEETLFQYGNNFYHAYEDKYIKENGGVVELHDANLSGVCMARYIYKEFRLDDYRRAIEHDLTPGTVQEILGEIGKANYPKEKDYVLNGFITDYADKIIVHSKWAEDIIRERNIGSRIKCIPHYAKHEKASSKIAVRKKLGISIKETIIAHFGFVHETKRPIAILEAMAKLHERFSKAKIYFVGEMCEEMKKPFEDICRKNGMDEYVRVTGFVDLSTFEDYMDAADICIQLRYPYNGEVSGAVARALGKGKCVIVSDIGSFGEIPDEVCVKVPSAENIDAEEEIKNIEKVLKPLLSSPKKVASYGKRAKKYAQSSLDIGKCCHDMHEFIEEYAEINSLTEAKLEKIRNYVIAEGYDEEQVRNLSGTLAYIAGE